MSKSLKLIVLLVLAAVIAGAAFIFLAPGGNRSGEAPEQAGTGHLTKNFRSNVFEKITAWELSLAGKDVFAAIPLTNGVLEGGESVEYTIEDGNSVCTYDMRITKEDGSVWHHKNRDLCTRQTYYTYDDEWEITFVNKTGGDLRFVTAEFRFNESTDFNHFWGMTLPDYLLAKDQSLNQGVTALGRICKGSRMQFRMKFGDNQTPEKFMNGVDFCALMDGGGTIEIMERN